MAFGITPRDSNPPAPQFPSSDPEAATVPALVVALAATQSFADVNPLETWNGTTLCTSTDAEWSAEAGTVVFLTSGLFEFTMQCAVSHEGAGWGFTDFVVGSQAGSSTKTQHGYAPNNNGMGDILADTVAWSDTFLVSGTAGQSMTPAVYHVRYSDTAPGTATVRLLVRRLGDEIAAS